MLRCVVCKKSGLEEDFTIDEKKRLIYCYDCAPDDMMRQWWPVDDEEEAQRHISNNDSQIRPAEK